jgi:prevent-host-death family protein
MAYRQSHCCCFEFLAGDYCIGYYDQIIGHNRKISIMLTVSLAEAKAHLSKLLNTVETGEEVIITRHGRAIARVSAPEQTKQPLPLKKLAALRGRVATWQEPSTEALRKLRDME